MTPLSRDPVAAVRFFARGVYLAALLHAWPLARVLERAARSDRLGLPARYAADPEAAARLAARLFHRWTLPWSSVCLVRALLLYALLHPSHDVKLVVGLRRPRRDSVHGHAWVTIDGRPLCREDVASPDAFTTLLTIPDGTDGCAKPYRGA